MDQYRLIFLLMQDLFQRIFYLLRKDIKITQITQAKSELYDIIWSHLKKNFKTITQPL